jgi:hypothetical protein
MFASLLTEPGSQRITRLVALFADIFAIVDTGESRVPRTQIIPRL